jgi:hypothetical protein
MVWKFPRAMTRNHLAYDFFLYKAPRAIARCALVIREKLFDAVVIP